MVAALVFVMALVVQLAPLPASWFGDRFPAGLLEGVGMRPAWTQLSLTPSATWAAAISAIPVLAVFGGVSQLDAPSRFKLVALVIALGSIALLVGFLQVMQGPQSGLRLYDFTNPSEAVGFFANRNHFAAQLYTMLIFAAAWFALQARHVARPGAYNSRATLWFAAAAGLLLATIAGLAIARSRAGVFLAMAAIAGIVAIIFAGAFKAQGNHAVRDQSAHVRRVAVVALGFAVLFSLQFGLQRVMTRFETDPLDDLRTALTPRTLQLAVENLPFGSGLGSFVPVYAVNERTEDLFSGYANRAHNDWAELLLETGVFGVLIAALFLAWFAMRAAKVWRGWKTREADFHLMLQRAATLAIGLLLAHSLVDYPLRTAAMATLFAFACAILIEPPKPEAVEASAAQQHRRRRSRRKTPGAHGEGRMHGTRMPPEPEAPPADAHHRNWSDAWQQGQKRAVEKDDDA